MTHRIQRELARQHMEKQNDLVKGKCQDDDFLLPPASRVSHRLYPKGCGDHATEAEKGK